MTSRFFVCIAGLAFLLCTVAGAQPLTIDPPGRTDLSQKSVPVTLTATGVTYASGSRPTFKDSAGYDTTMITATNIKLSSDFKTLAATFVIDGNAWGTVKVTVVDAKGNPETSPFDFDTGVVCLEALESTGCALRWEVDATGVTGSSNQTSKTTAPNILFKLDFQLAKNKDTALMKSRKTGKPLTPDAKRGPHSFADRLTTHLIFKTGYTQMTSATKLQPTSNNSVTTTSGNATASSGSCTGTSNSSTSSNTSTPSSCTAATPQQAFVAEAGGTLGWTFFRDGQGTFSEIGLGARGSFQDLVQSNQVVQSGGVSYVDLSSANPRNTIGLYEAVGRFRLSALGHDAPANHSGVYKHNPSDLLVIEAGYQNNSGLQQLAANPQTSTRNRFVGRFYAYPELPGPTHTKILVGMEYSGGINGGPKVVQIFFGTNVNPAKLFQSSKASNNSPAPQ
jgi:hypothetical protein